MKKFSSIDRICGSDAQDKKFDFLHGSERSIRNHVERVIGQLKKKYSIRYCKKLSPYTKIE